MKNLKLELEKVYKDYCDGSLIGIKGEDEFVDVLYKFVEFRLWVSGGDKWGAGSIGCESVEGFLNEIFLFEDMMSDWSGVYRGDLCYEANEGLDEVISKSDLEENIKEDILKGFRDNYDIEIFV
jgi:hypothetical protein